MGSLTQKTKCPPKRHRFWTHGSGEPVVVADTGVGVVHKELLHDVDVPCGGGAVQRRPPLVVHGGRAVRIPAGDTRTPPRRKRERAGREGDT